MTGIIMVQWSVIGAENQYFIFLKRRIYLQLIDFIGGEGGIRTHVGLLTPIRFRVGAVMATSVPLRGGIH